MKTIAVRLSESSAAEIAAEARARGISRSEVIRERLDRAATPGATDTLSGIADLIGSVDGLPADLSARTKAYLREALHDRKRPR